MAYLVYYRALVKQVGACNRRHMAGMFKLFS